jgi:Na+-transporting NADH:ubiquinone oxidoreductase subunit C
VKDSLQTIIYAAVLGIVCATLLTGAAGISAPYKESNARAEEIRNILAVLDVPFDSEASSSELVKVFEQTVRTEKRGELTAYVYFPAPESGLSGAVAVPFTGRGLWGPIKGLLSLKPDMKTIHGITFYEQEETPGLGGEIASQWFRNQFKGKRLEDAAGTPGIRIRRDGAVALNEVDGITGATMTSQKVETILNTVIERIVEEYGDDGK